MVRRYVNLRLNSDVVKRAKNAGVNFSYFLEEKLVEYMTIMNGTPSGRISCKITSKIILFSHDELEKEISIFTSKKLNSGEGNLA